MTIGTEKLKQAASDMKAATALVAEEAGNPDIAEEVKREATEIFKDLGETIEGDVTEICGMPHEWKPEDINAGEPVAVSQGDGDGSPSASDWQ